MTSRSPASIGIFSDSRIWRALAADDERDFPNIHDHGKGVRDAVPPPCGLPTAAVFLLKYNF